MEIVVSLGCLNAGGVCCLTSALQVVQQHLPPAKCKSILNTVMPSHPLSFASKLTSYSCLYLFTFEIAWAPGWAKMFQEVGSNCPGRETGRILLTRVWRKKKKKKTQNTTPDDFQPSYFEKPLKQSPQESSAEPCDHLHRMWARTEVSWSFAFQKQGRRTGV